LTFVSMSSSDFINGGRTLAALSLSSAVFIIGYLPTAAVSNELVLFSFDNWVLCDWIPISSSAFIIGGGALAAVSLSSSAF
jgi:hypothetical protein